jgi:hypothetical protein
MKQQGRKSSSGAKKAPALTYQPKLGRHWLLVNKKTGKVSSSNNWLIALAAVAVTNRDSRGLPSLLPQSKAEKLLTTNKLVLRSQRGVKSKLINAEAREQAKCFIPALAVLWEKEKPQHRPPRRQDFCQWVVKSLQNPKTRAYTTAVKRGHHEILGKADWRWWLARLEKMQS